MGLADGAAETVDAAKDLASAVVGGAFVPLHAGVSVLSAINRGVCQTGGAIVSVTTAGVNGLEGAVKGFLK